MTYAQLKAVLDAANDEQLQQGVTIYLNGEYYPIKAAAETNETDVLDEGHLYLVGF